MLSSECSASVGIKLSSKQQIGITVPIKRSTFSGLDGFTLLLRLREAKLFHYGTATEFTSSYPPAHFDLFCDPRPHRIEFSVFDSIYDSSAHVGGWYFDCCTNHFDPYGQI